LSLAVDPLVHYMMSRA